MSIKRILDLILALIAGIFLALPAIIVGILIKLTSNGPVFYKSDRIGRDNVVFSMYKFRTMRIDTPPVATHLLENPDHYLIPSGRRLRRSSLDELPQIINIIKGDMSFVGPRPALYNQDDLISLRTKKGIHKLVPGLTGWAQINGRDELPIPQKVEFDAYYMANRSIILDLHILFLTVLKVLRKEGVSH
jgi:O-antigen biosynthesis protein WbqP